MTLKMVEKNPHTNSLSEVHTFSKSCCGILNSWLMCSSKIKADSRGLIWSDSNATSVGKDKAIFTQWCLGHNDCRIGCMLNYWFRSLKFGFTVYSYIRHLFGICGGCAKLISRICHQSWYSFLLYFVWNNSKWFKNNSVSLWIIKYYQPLSHY